MNSPIPNRFKPQEFAKKWQEKWEKERIYSPDFDSYKNPSFAKASEGRPYYNLMMFPYPSAEGLHVGNMYAFTGVDVTGRFKRMSGFDVFEPIGLDGFGIHSENYALKVNKHPQVQAQISQKNFYKQLRAIGNSFDWERTLETYDPDYYRWTQWLFVQMFKHGLAYRAKASVNYCPSCKTVLADEQVIKQNQISNIKYQKHKSNIKNEDINVCERCGTEVVMKELEQWFFKITQYAEKLLQNTCKPQFNWSDKVKIGQQKWIGRSEGVQIEFKNQSFDSAQDKSIKVKVYTTAIDTIYGVTFMVLSPKHALLKQLEFPIEYKQSVLKYIKDHQKDTKEILNKEKSGIFTGLYLINPINNRSVPLWIADYVLMEYGTGAIMSVPAHDKRDHDFAKQYNLPIVAVIKPIKEYQNTVKVETDGFWDYGEIKNEFADKSVLFNSDRLNGLTSTEAKKKLEELIIKNNIGKKEIHYHLRDWLISRQRYWGAPIPMIYCEKCAKKDDNTELRTQNSMSNKENLKTKNLSSGHWDLSSPHSNVGWFPVPEDQLPVLLPDVADWRPTGTGRGPLAGHPEFYNTTCPNCGGKAVRETDVCDTFLDSSWYYLRYPFVEREIKSKLVKFDQLDKLGDAMVCVTGQDKKITAPSSTSVCNDNGELLPWDNEITQKILPIDSYIGGAEHTVLHLLYTRFVYMALIDWGLLKVRQPSKSDDFIDNEPFIRFYAHGLIIKDGNKMSKSKGNVVVPDEYINLYGADTLRTYLMFLGPFNSGGDFRDTGIAGMYKWLSRVWRLVSEVANLQKEKSITDSQEAQKQINALIKFVTQELENLRFNTSIAKMMEFTNWWMDHPEQIDQNIAKDFIKLLAPFAPYMCEELYQKIINSKFEIRNSKFGFGSVHQANWPKFDEKILIENTLKIIIQINGKTRDLIDISSQTANLQKEVEQLAFSSAKISKWLGKAQIKKTIFVPKKLINFVI